MPLTVLAGVLSSHGDPFRTQWQSPRERSLDVSQMSFRSERYEQCEVNGNDGVINGRLAIKYKSLGPTGAMRSLIYK